MSKANRIFLLVALIFGFALLSMWYRYHPSSPYYAKTEYTFVFPEVGTLEPNNDVRVNGILAGSVRSVSLMETGVIVKASVLDKARLSKDIRVRVVNFGLVGERMIDIRLGYGASMYTALDTIYGQYDPGSTTLVVTAGAMFAEMNSLFKALKEVTDSTFAKPMNIERMKRIGANLNHLKNRSKTIKNMGEQEILAIVEQIKTGVGSLEQNTGKWSDRWSNLKTKKEPFETNLIALANNLSTLENKINKYSAIDGSAKKLLTDEFYREFTNVWNRYITLHQTILSREIQLNVDLI
jgi:hypothetical protein